MTDLFTAMQPDRAIDQLFLRVQKLEQGITSPAVTNSDSNYFPNGIVVEDPVGTDLLVDGLPLTAPVGLALAKGTFYERSFIDASWTAKANAAGYLVEVAEKIGGVYQQAQNYQTIPNVSRIEPVKPATTYGVRVAAYTRLGIMGASSAWVDITTDADATIPAAVAGLTVTAGIRSIVATWTDATDADVANGSGGYRVQIDTVNTFNSGNLRTKMVAGSIVSFSDLAPGTTYYVRVQAVDSSGNAGAYTAAGSATTGMVLGTDVGFTAGGDNIAKDGSFENSTLSDFWTLVNGGGAWTLTGVGNGVDKGNCVQYATTVTSATWGNLKQSFVPIPGRKLSARFRYLLSTQVKQAHVKIDFWADAGRTTYITGWFIMGGTDGPATSWAEWVAQGANAYTIPSNAVLADIVFAGGYSGNGTSAISYFDHFMLVYGDVVPEYDANSAAIYRNAVGNMQIADLAVDSAKIANLAVGTAKIADLAVTNAKINDLVASKITTGSITAANITLAGGSFIGGSGATGPGFVLNSQGMSFYNSSGVRTIYLSALDGALTITGTTASFNITGTNITGSIITGTTYKSATSGARIEISTTPIGSGESAYNDIKMFTGRTGGDNDPGHIYSDFFTVAGSFNWGRLILQPPTPATGYSRPQITMVCKPAGQTSNIIVASDQTLFDGLATFNNGLTTTTITASGAVLSSDVIVSSLTGGTWDYQGLRSQGTTPGLTLWNPGAGTAPMMRNSGGNFHFQNSGASAYVALLASAFTVSSSIETKYDVQPLQKIHQQKELGKYGAAPKDGNIVSVLDRLKQMRGVKFKRPPTTICLSCHGASKKCRECKGKDVRSAEQKVNEDTYWAGVIAEEVVQHFPEAIVFEEGKPVAVDLSGLVAVLIESVKELAEQVESAKSN